MGRNSLVRDRGRLSCGDTSAELASAATSQFQRNQEITTMPVRFKTVEEVTYDKRWPETDNI